MFVRLSVRLLVGLSVCQKFPKNEGMLHFYALFYNIVLIWDLYQKVFFWHNNNIPYDVVEYDKMEHNLVVYINIFTRDTHLSQEERGGGEDVVPFYCIINF